jgi:hypothetical protein
LILQPTLVILCGAGSDRLKGQIARWIGEEERRAFYFADVQDEKELEQIVPAAVGELRSSRLLTELIRNGYVPKNHRMQEFRTLIVCLSEDQDWVRAVRRQVEVSLQRTPFLNRIFWVLLLKQEKMDDLEEMQQKLFADFRGNESVTLFHVLPVWRGSDLDAEETAAILERIAVLLLKADAEASLPLISQIALNKNGWAVGIEAYKLKGHTEAGKCALFMAARELIAQCFTGRAMSAATLANLVREKIPDFDSQANVDPFTPEGLDLVGRYVRNYVPDLLDALASHSPNVESWLDCLKYLKRETARPKKLSLRGTTLPALNAKPKPAYSALSIMLMTVSAAACYLLWKPNDQLDLELPETPAALQQLPPHPILAAALERVLVDIQPLRYPELLQEGPANPGAESSIPTDCVENASVDRDLINAARDILLQRTFALPSLLSFQFMSGEMTPASAMAQVLSAQAEMEQKLETMLIGRWLKNIRESRSAASNTADNDWLDFMFSSPIPNPVHMECEIADHRNGAQQPGWFPPSWLHYFHAVAIR